MRDTALLPAEAAASANGEYEGAWAPSPSDLWNYGEGAFGPEGVHCCLFVWAFGKR